MKKRKVMAKYYVRDGMEMAVVDASTPLEGCCKAVLHFFNTFAVNGFYIVSERGFSEHSDDIVFSSNDIIDILSEYFKENGEDF
tara:strand:+ start:718 stop:969 length:252 start_codon:yes stop_codon:yes gene_type:complete